jgi:HEPN domain-containing protein
MMGKPQYKKFKKEYSDKLFRIAENDLYAAEFLMNAPKCRPELIIYQCQQAVEKLIKAVIVQQQKPVALTHDIELLMTELEPEDLQLLPEGAGELTQYATLKRYTEGDEILTLEDVNAAIKTAKIFLDWANTKLTR